MDEPRLNPLRDRQRPLHSDHHVADDDIELPPKPESLPTQEPVQPEIGAGLSPPRPIDNRGRRWAIWGVAVVAGMAFGAWYYSGSSTEAEHPNWEHVMAATEASDASSAALTHVEDSGATSIVAEMEISGIDIDRETTRRVRAALQSNLMDDAAEYIRAGQDVEGSPRADAPTVDLEQNSELARAIEEEATKFFHVDVFDCCDEDGDVVQIIVNGDPFITVPITHQGATVSVPLTRGTNTIALRGVRDGGGGITVSFRTSHGEYFTKRMRVGEEHQFGVVVR